MSNGKNILISGDPGVILSTSDSKNWNLIKHDIEALSVRNGLYANNRYLFTADSSILIYNNNEFLPLKKESINKVTVYKNEFLSLGEDILLSDDGITWTAVAKIEELDINSIDVNLDNFIIVGSDIIFPQE